MGKKKIYILILAIIFILITSFWMILDEQNNRENQRQTVSQKNNSQNTNSENQSSESLKQVETVLYNNKNTVKWLLNSEEVVNFNSENFIDLLNLDIDVFDIETNSENQLYTFTAPSGKYFNQKRILKLQGPVQIEKNNYLLTAGNMKWLQKENKVKGNEGVEITTPSLILKGNKFESELKLDSITVSGNENQRAHLYWKENQNESNSP